MKKICLSFSLILMLATVGLLPALASDPIIIGLSKFKKEDREVKDFNGIAAGGPINVVITLGNTESLRFEGDADAIAALIAEVKSNVLIIRPQNNWANWTKKYENKKIKAYVSAKSIKSLTMSGNGSMTVKGNIQENSLTSVLSGSGSVSATIDVDNYTGVISGSGNLNISGKADKATITISGSGSLTKKGLSVSNVSAVVSGSGSVYINAEDHIKATITGSGSINYSGNATVEQRTIGSGGVRKM